MSLVPSRPDPYNELAYLIMDIGGRAIHAIPRHRRMGGGARLRFAIPSKAAAEPIVRLCRRQGWKFTQPSGIQMVVDVPVTLAQILAAGQRPRQPTLGEGQRELPSG